MHLIMHGLLLHFPVVVRIYMLVGPLVANASFLSIALVFLMHSLTSASNLINCGAMAGREKGVELAAVGCERKRMRARFCSNASELLHRPRVEYVDGARAANGNVETSVRTIEEHDVWRAA